MNAARELPTRRNAPIIDFQLADGYASQGYSAQYAEFSDGELAEVFLVPAGGPAARVGMPLDTMAKDLSVLFSIARRYGAPVDVIRAALSQQADGKMLGPLGEFLRLHAGEKKSEGEEPNSAPVIDDPGPMLGGGAIQQVEVV